MMKKLLVSLAVGAAVLVPGAAALADIPEPVGHENCPPGYRGRVVWHWNPVTRTYDHYPVCIFIGE